MNKFTFKRTILLLPVIFLVIFSSVAFGQMKKVNTPSVVVTFQADMSYQLAKGTFNPLVDFVDIAGTMNDWAGSAHLTFVVGTDHVYEITYTLDSNSIQEYKFRINGLAATSEFPNGPNRMYRVPSQADTVRNIFSDYEPGTVPVTFKCHMGYQMLTGNFDKTADYLDIAGNLNNWGAYDVLFDRGNDSIYVINMNVDTTYVSTVTPVEFKFRINGNWLTSEFPDGGANRIFRVEDTTSGYKNIVDVWFNDEDPAIPSPPEALNVVLQGNLAVGETLTGSYTYADVNGDPEGNSKFNWFRADSLTQPQAEEIIGVHSESYVLTAEDVHKYVAFQVTPIAASGNPSEGFPVRIWSAAFVAGVGINEAGLKSIRYYPNPAGDNLFIEYPGNIDMIEVFNIIGEKTISINEPWTGKISLNTSNLKHGIYFIKFYGKDLGTSTLKFMKK
jgi:hypothetical protein